MTLCEADALVVSVVQKGNSPQQYIAAHLSKIHGLDWSPDNQYHFVTASQDGYVKVSLCTVLLYF